MAFNCARTGTGIFACWVSTSMGMDHYQNWYSVLSIPALAFWNFGSVLVWAYSITGTVIKWCQYRYWHFWILVQYQYWHGTLPVLALNGVHIGIGICAFWSSTSISMVYHRYWHSMVPKPALAFVHFGPVPLLAPYIICTGIEWCPYWYWHFCTLGQYQNGYSTLPVQALNGASTCYVKGHYAKCHKIYAEYLLFWAHCQDW